MIETAKHTKLSRVERNKRIILKVNNRLMKLKRAKERYEAEIFIQGKDTIAEIDADGSDVYLDQKVERLVEEIKFIEKLKEEYR